MAGRDDTQLKLFMDEAVKRLAISQTDLRSLDDHLGAVDPAVLQRLIRTFRGVRGSAELLGLSAVVQLSQLMETLLYQVDQQSITVDREVTAHLVSGLETLHLLLIDLDLSGSPDVQQQIELLQDLLDRRMRRESSAVVEPEFEPELESEPEQFLASDPWQQPVMAPVGAAPFELERYPDAVAAALYHGLSFFAVQIDRQQFRPFVEKLLAVGSVIDSDPLLSEELELDPAYDGDTIWLLFSTILKPELLMGLLQLQAYQLQPMPVSESLQQRILSSPSLGMDQEPEQQLIEPEPPTTGRDILEEVKLGEAERQMRQAYFDELERKQRLLEQQMEQLQQVQAAAMAAPPPPPVAPAPPVTNHPPKTAANSRWLFIALAVAGVTWMAWLTWHSRATVDSAALSSSRPVPAMKMVAAPVPPTSPPPAAATVAETKPSAPAASAVVAPAAPATSAAAPAAAETKPATAPAAPATPATTTTTVTAATTGAAKTGLEPFANQLLAMDRLLDEPPYTIVQGNKVGNGLAFRRNGSGGVDFSIASIMHQKFSRAGGESFTITPETMNQVRLVFQIKPREAYMVPIDESGQVSVAKEFWQPFAKMSQKAVSVSRVLKTGASGLQLRDLTAIKTQEIVKRLEP
ncbi:MAG: hypothetical protein HQL58_00915 [Magnetococcales bacterium]|nr:hypothetical protein [Magnetococcales bacterium]